MKKSRDELLKDIVELLESLREDWEYSGEITPETSLIKDVGLESIDLVALGSAIEEKYHQNLPFAEFLATLEARNATDLRIGDVLEFLEEKLN